MKFTIKNALVIGSFVVVGIAMANWAKRVIPGADEILGEGGSFFGLFG